MKIHLAENAEIPVGTRITEAITQAVASGEVDIGEKLPPRKVLAEELGVSVATVRHAYEKLERQGVLASRQGSGTYVRRDALEQIQGRRGGHLTGTADIHVVVGASQLADCPHFTIRIVTEVLAGVTQGLGSRAGRFTFVRALNRECLGELPEGSIVLLRAKENGDPAFAAELLQCGVRVINIGAESDRFDVPHIHVDPHQPAELACQHLIACGYRRLGYIGTMGDSAELAAKFFGFTNALYKAGLDYQVRHVGDTLKVPGMAFAGAQKVLASGDPPDAFFVDTDYHAMEVIAAIKAAGLSVPEDIGVIGYDDVPEAATFSPALTTVHMPHRAVGRRVAELLLNWPGVDRLPRSIALEPHVVARESTRIVDPVPGQTAVASH